MALIASTLSVSRENLQILQGDRLEVSVSKQLSKADLSKDRIDRIISEEH